jgi:hypothetical protein
MTLPLLDPPLQTDSSDVFDLKAFALTAALPNWSSQVNALGNSITSMYDGIISFSNFLGNYSSLSGAVNIPAACYYNGSFWQLVANTSNAASDVPGVSAKWVAAQGSSSTDSTKLPLTGGTMTGPITALRETKVSMGASAIDLAAGNVFTKTITGATTFTLSNVAATGTVNEFLLDLTNGGAYAITWWSGLKWAGGTVPTFTASGRDLLGFVSHDGNTTWSGMLLAKGLA